MSVSTGTAREHARLERSRLVDPWRLSLWVVQLLLAATFADDGLVKATQPIAVLIEAFTWPSHTTLGLVRVIGFIELVAALGLVLPTATRIVPGVTPIAASFLTLLMGLAFVFHIMCGHWQMLPSDIVLGLLTAFVAWGRFVKAPVDPRFLD